jgi:D-amino-acid dehydrogenase
VSLLDDAAKIVSSTLGDRLRVAGTAELAGWNLDIRKQRTDPLLTWAKRYFPDLDYENVIPWAGLRPMTPNMMPVVRRHHVHKNIWFNTGHGHLGWTLGAYTAKQVSSMIVDAG